MLVRYYQPYCKIKYLQDNGIATVIGTSVGNNPTGATTYVPYKLPKTKANVSIAITYKEQVDIFKKELRNN